MNDIDLCHRDFRRTDLNLLVAFDALMQERHVGRAAARVFIGQSAMSHALGRLRETLGDEIFIRAGNRMEPTALALQLAPRVRVWLDQASGFLFEKNGFDPREARGTVKLAIMDGLEAVLLPRLLTLLWHEAPSIAIAVKQLQRDEALAALDAEDIDIALGAGDLPFREWHCQEHFATTRFDCVYSTRQLTLPSPLPLALLAEQKHIGMSWAGGGWKVKSFFESKGYNIDFIAFASSQMAICRTLAALPVVTVQPDFYTTIYRNMPDLAVIPVASCDLTAEGKLIWHRRNEYSAVNRYIRSCLRKVYAEEMAQIGPRPCAGLEA